MADATLHRVAGIVLTAVMAVAGCGASSPPAQNAAVVAQSATAPNDSARPSPSAAPTPSPQTRPTRTAAPQVTPTSNHQEPDALASEVVSEWYLTIVPIDDQLRSQMEPTSWREGCPIVLDELRLLRFPHTTFDGDVAEGELVISAPWAEAVGGVFAELFAVGYPVERIELVDRFDGDDQQSMVANNTSGFNCREVAYTPGVWSNHAWGTAIDLNPLYNPYVSGDFVDPAAAAAYVDRTVIRTGMVADGDAAVVAFERIGWTWGGRWEGVKDYQHFSANGR